MSGKRLVSADGVRLLHNDSDKAMTDDGAGNQCCCPDQQPPCGTCGACVVVPNSLTVTLAGFTPRSCVMNEEQQFPGRHSGFFFMPAINGTYTVPFGTNFEIVPPFMTCPWSLETRNFNTQIRRGLFTAFDDCNSHFATFSEIYEADLRILVGKPCIQEDGAFRWHVRVWLNLYRVFSNGRGFANRLWYLGSGDSPDVQGFAGATAVTTNPTNCCAQFQVTNNLADVSNDTDWVPPPNSPSGNNYVAVVANDTGTATVTPVCS